MVISFILTLLIKELKLCILDNIDIDSIDNKYKDKTIVNS